MSWLDDLDISEKLDDLKARGAAESFELIERRGGEYFDDLIEEGDKQIDELVPEEHKKEADEALEIIAGLKTPLLRLTNSGLAQLLGHWQNNEEAEARRFYLAHNATYAERRAAMNAAGDRLVDNEDADKAAWEAVESGLKKVGTVGLKFLGKLVLGSLGIPIG